MCPRTYLLADQLTIGQMLPNESLRDPLHLYQRIKRALVMLACG